MTKPPFVSGDEVYYYAEDGFEDNYAGVVVHCCQLKDANPSLREIYGPKRDESWIVFYDGNKGYSTHWDWAKHVRKLTKLEKALK